MKAYTDIEQSKKLAKFLPLESADMCWIEVNYGDEAGSRHEPSLATYKTVCHFRDSIFPKDHTIPCWSLSALLGVLPRETRLLKSATDDTYHCNCPKSNVDEWFGNPVDACHKMIMKLHELKML